jgi:hypothetical protein
MAYSLIKHRDYFNFTILILYQSPIHVNVSEMVSSLQAFRLKFRRHFSHLRYAPSNLIYHDLVGLKLFNENWKLGTLAIAIVFVQYYVTR